MLLRLRGLGSATAIALLAVGATLAPAPDAPPDQRAWPTISTNVAAPGAFASAPPPRTPREEPERAAAPQAAVGAPQETTAPAATPGGRIPDGFRVQLPRLGIDLPIQEGDLKRDIEDQRTPEGYAFHLPGTAIPGQNANTFLYAHARRQMFLTLWNARPGDEVIVRAPDGGLLEYVVRDILPHVAPTDVSATRPGSTEQLTLQTSTGPSPGDPRFIVVAFPR